MSNVTKVKVSRAARRGDGYTWRITLVEADWPLPLLEADAALLEPANEGGPAPTVAVAKAQGPSAPLTGTFALALAGYETTPLAWNATAGAVADAVAALPPVAADLDAAAGAGANVTVTRGPLLANGGYTWSVTFRGGDDAALYAGGTGATLIAGDARQTFSRSIFHALVEIRESWGWGTDPHRDPQLPRIGSRRLL